MLIAKFFVAIGLLAMAGGFGVFLGWLEKKLEDDNAEIK